MYINHINMIITMAHRPLLLVTEWLPGWRWRPGGVRAGVAPRHGHGLRGRRGFVQGLREVDAGRRGVAHVLRRKNWDKNGDFRGNSWDL